MAAPKTGTPGYERLKAHRIRKAIEAGKPVTEEKRSWLASYEASKGKTRTAAPHVKTATIETNPVEAQATAVPQTAPPPMEVPPLAGFGAPSAPDSSATEQTGTETTNSPSASATSPASQKEAAVASIVEMAASAWIAGMDALKKMTGAEERMFPDAFVDKIWKPAATRLGVKYMPDEMGSDIADIAIVVGPPAVTGVAIYRVGKAKQLAAAQNAEIESKPAGAPEPAAPHSEPHPSGEDTPNGVLTSKTDIRRAKLDMEQFKGKVF